jgi:nicotinamidase-related amidase
VPADGIFKFWQSFTPEDSMMKFACVRFTLAALLGLLFLSSAGFSKPPRSVLLVIDMQSNLLRPGKGGLHVDSLLTDSLIKSVNRNIHAAVSAGIPVVYIVNEWTNPFVNYFTHNVCKKGGPGTWLDPRVDIVDSLLFHKSVPNSFSNKDFQRFVDEQGVKEIYISGIMVEGCVGSTARHSLKRGLTTKLIVPAIGSSLAAKLKKGIAALIRQGAQTVQEIEERPAR